MDCCQSLLTATASREGSRSIVMLFAVASEAGQTRELGIRFKRDAKESGLGHLLRADGQVRCQAF